MATRRIDLVIALHDEFSEKLNRIQKMAGRVEASFSKTRRAAQMLDRQKIEPLMQIRDRLTAPAMKAQALVKRLDLQTAEPRASLRDLVTGKAREIGGALRGLASHTWTVTIQAKDRVTDVARRITGALTSPLAMLGAGAGATAAIAFPLKLAGEMDRARRSIELYSGSVEAGRKNFEELVNLAIKSPIYEVPFVVEQAGQLLAKGQNINFAKRALNAFGNAAMYTGASLERLELAFYGFGQIASIGTLSMEELKQVTENLNVPLNWIAEELGITGDQLCDLGKAGIPAQQAMEAIVRTLEKRFPVRDFNNDLLALVSNVKEAARVVVWKFGEGIVQPVIRILQDMAGILDPTSEKFKQFQQEIIDAGLRVGEAFERAYSKLKKFFDGLSKNEAFQKMDWGDKIVYVLDQMIQAIDEWVSGSGGKQVEKVFVRLAEIGARAWLTALGGLVKGAGESLLRGNILGGIGLLAGAGLLGGGMLVRGAWSVGKGALGLGSRILGRGTATGAGVAAEIAAGTAATASRGSRIMRVLHEWFVAPASKRALEPLKRTVIPAAPEQVFRYRGFISGAPEVEAFRIPGTATRAVGGGFAPLRYIGMFGKAGNIISRMALPLTFATGAVEIAHARPEERVQTGLKVGGRIAGGLAGAAIGAKAGAAIGTAIAPGLGTAVGGALGGLVGGIAGAIGGEAIVKQFDKIRVWGSGACDAIKQKASDAWSWISTNITFESLARGAGYALGYLEETIFNSAWWAAKWENVKTWASNTWSGMVNVWNSAKETIDSTIFSGDWWAAKWEAVKTWTGNAWATAAEIWESIKTTINNTLFSKEWWDEKWNNVKKWASDTWDTIRGEWDKISKSFGTPVETLRGWLRKGKLKGVKVGSMWRIPERELKAITEPEGRLAVYTTWNRVAEAARKVGVELPMLPKDVPARLVPLEADGVRIPFWLEVELQTFTGRYEPCSEIDGEDTMLADWVPGLLEKYNREGVALPEDILQYLE